MMLTAIPTNPSPSVFAHNHTPSVASSSSPSQLDSSDTAPQAQGSAHILRGGMDSKATSVSAAVAATHTSNQAHTPAQLIPMTAVHQPFILGAGGAGYTLVPSIHQLGNLSAGSEAPMFGLQPLSAISTLPRAAAATSASMQPLTTLPMGYYSRVQSEAIPMSFQQLTAASLSPPMQLTAGRPPTPTPTPTTSTTTTTPQLVPPPPSHQQHHHHQHHPGTLLISSTGNGVVTNGNLTSGMEPKPGLRMGQQMPSSPPSPSPSQLQRESSLDKTSSSSDPNLHQSVSMESLNDAESLGRRSDPHIAHSYSRSRAARQASRSITNTQSPTAEGGLPKDVLVKREPLGDDTSIPHHHHHSAVTTRRNSDSNLEETAAGSSSKSYQISALIDIPPMAPPLNRASRTSSLSSSLSSFRFGGSLSQLWASQISLSGKINNMKSTGNINADAAVMPSLGNQYFAFGGSLPELSLTSLTRLLPNSSASDPSMSSCPGLFTLPLYVYPSQQHLATPFINTHGSITFGSFLSSGSSLCSTSKGPMGGSASSNVSANVDSAQPGDTSTSSGANVTGNGDEKSNGCGHGAGSTSSLPESVIKLPMYPNLSGALLAGSGGGEGSGTVISLPSFSTLTRGLESSTMDVSGSNNSISSSSSHSNLPLMSVSNLIARSSSSLPNQNHLRSCVVAEATNRQLHSHPCASDPTPHPSHPHHLPLHAPHPHICSTTTPDHSTDKHLPVPHPPLSPVQSNLYMNQNTTTLLQTVPISRIKTEADMEPRDLSPAMAHGLPIMSPEGAHLHSPHGNVLAPSGGARGVKKDKPYKCDHPGCGRSFSFPAHLRSHIQQIHISYRPCKCEFPGCGKRFYTPQHLNVHRRVHTGERPFVCPYADCSKAFTTAGNLKNHIRTHTGERPYACKFEGCSKRFAEMSSLKKHELTHTGEKPYKCRVCGKAFSQAGSRNTHERKHNRSGSEEEEGSRGSVAVSGAAMGADGSDAVAKGSKKYRIKRISGNGSTDELMQH